MKRFLLAHDLGTSGNKASLFTTEGKLVASTTVVPLMQQLPVVQMFAGWGLAQEEPSP